MFTPEELSQAYRSRELVGWGEYRNPGLAKQQFHLLSSQGIVKPTLHIVGQTTVYAGKKMMLYQVVRNALGYDTINYPQEIGDCVSFGAKNATEYLQCTQLLMANDVGLKWRPVFAPFYYGTGRVYVGGGRLGNGDGSLGSWMAAAVQKYGTLFADDKDVPAYSGRVAKAWGDPNPRPDLDAFRAQAAPFKVGTAALVRSWADFVAAIVNGYPCTTASDVGYSMTPSADGFHRQTDSWAHQMCFIGVDDNDRDPYAVLLNSWGDAHGRLKDFADGHDLPVGCLRVRRRDVEKHLAANETFAFGHLDAFYENRLDKKLFHLLGA